MAKQNFFSKFWAQRRADTAAKLYQKSEYGAWAETLNPLRGLTEQGARNIFDRARQGIFADLVYLYSEIEAADPTLMTVAERREAVVGASDWKIVNNNPERKRGYDETLASEQRDYLNSAYGNADDALSEVAEHLERGFFRGFAHARPIYSGRGLEGFDQLEQWNFAYDKFARRWWWNPDASAVYNDNFREVPDGELVSVVRQRHIDYPGLLIFVRAALGEKKYGIFLERYGIPPVTVIMPPDVDRGEENAYFDAAEKLAGAGFGAMPHGSSVSYATEARGTNPFIEFLDHQQRLIVLMATGGTLTTLASATGIGSGASETQQDTWREIVRRDIRAASRAINRVVTPKLLEMEFPGRPRLVSFEFDVDPAPTASDAFEDAAKAKAAGYLIDREQLEEVTGYKLVLDESAAAQMGTFAGFGAANANSGGYTDDRSVAKPLQNAVKRCKDADPTVDTPTAANAANGRFRAIGAPPPDPLLAVLAVLEAGGSVEAALEAYDEAAGAALEVGTERIARRIADAMEAAVAEVLDEGDAAAQNANPNREKGGQFAEEGTGDMTGDGGTKDGHNPDSAATQAAEIGKGRSALQKCLETKEDVYAAVSRGDIGTISFFYGTPGDPNKEYKGGSGLSHIVAKHGEEILDQLPTTIIRGTLGPIYEQGRKRNIVLGEQTAALRLDWDGKKESWVVTAFNPNEAPQTGRLKEER